MQELGIDNRHNQYVTQHIERYQLSEDWILSCGDAKSKSQNMVPKSILRFQLFWNLQYSIFKLLEGFGAKTVCSCKKGLLNRQNTNTLYRFPNLRAFFSKSTFHQSVMTSFMKLPYLKNTLCDFKHFCTKIEQKEQPFRKQQRVSFDLLTQLVPFDVLSHKCVWFTQIFKVSVWRNKAVYTR